MNKFADFVKKIINLDKYDISLGNTETNGNYISLIIKSELFTNDYVEIKLPEKGYDFDLKSEIESMKISINDMKLNIENGKKFLYEIEKSKENVQKILFMEVVF